MLVAVTLTPLACGGDGEGSARRDGGDPRREPIDGEPDALGLRFVAIEDGELRGELRVPDALGDDDGAPFALLSAPADGELRLEADGRAFRYRPDADFHGLDGFDYGTRDGRVLRATVEVAPMPDAPRFEARPPAIAEVGRPYAATLLASDADGDPLRFAASGLPGWLALDPASGELFGTPAPGDVGLVEGIGFSVSDPSGLVDSLDGVVLEVIDTGGRSSLDLAGFPTRLDGGESVAVEVLADVADAPTLTVESGPGLAARVEGGRVLLEAADVERVTEVELVLVATDRLGGVRREALALTLQPLSGSGAGRTLLGSRSGPGVHLVVLGDGYRADQQTLLRDDARALIALLESDPGTAAHLAAFNVHVIDSVSAEAGVDDDSVSDTRDTLYDAHYGCRDVPRLVCANTRALFEAALADYPRLDQLVLFVNDGRFGGSGNSGGSVAITARAAPEIAVHEMGHSLAGLADEYVDGALIEPLAPTFVEGRYPNVTAIADPSRVPWARWIDAEAAPSAPGEAGVGVFEGALYRAEGLYRPTATSRMRDYAEPFGPVNAERWALGVYRAANTVRAFAPLARRLELIAGESQRFSVTPFFGTDVQAIEWSLDGEPIRQAENARVLEIAPPAGAHSVTLAVRDVSGLIRLPPPHAGVFEWSWEVVVR